MTDSYKHKGLRKKLVAEIKKGYTDDNTTPYGNTIDVYMSWISNPDVYISEFIVDPDFIIKSLQENCDMELVERDDFENLYEKIRISNQIQDLNHCFFDQSSHIWHKMTILRYK